MSQILFILSGSIACYKACDAISQLVQRGHRVRVVATEAALKFVGTATLEGLTGEKVGHALFAEGEALEHVSLARWADITIVCPATANTLNRLAAGVADDLAGAILLAHDWRRPLLVAPAMNPAMWSHPATVAAVRRLREWGVRFIEVGSGRTACGEIGAGRMAEPDAIVSAVEQTQARPARRLRVLITSGGTSEPIDGVRVLTNTSTGATGVGIAEQFSRAGHEVVLLRAARSRGADGACREATFESFADLDVALGDWLGREEFDAIVHAAAVGDFSVETIEINGQQHPPGQAKLGSEIAPTLRLRRNPKLLDALRTRSRNPRMRVVAFKLTRGADGRAAKQAIQTLWADGAVDFVVHNDLLARTVEGRFPADIWRADSEEIVHCSDRTELASTLVDMLEKDIAHSATAGAPDRVNGGSAEDGLACRPSRDSSTRG